MFRRRLRYEVSFIFVIFSTLEFVPEVTTIVAVEATLVDSAGALAAADEASLEALETILAAEETALLASVGAIAAADEAALAALEATHEREDAALLASAGPLAAADEASLAALETTLAAEEAALLAPAGALAAAEEIALTASEATLDMEDATLEAPVGRGTGIGTIIGKEGVELLMLEATDAADEEFVARVQNQDESKVHENRSIPEAAADTTLLTTLGALEMLACSLLSAFDSTTTAAGRVETVRGAVGCGTLAQYGRTMDVM